MSSARSDCPTRSVGGSLLLVLLAGACSESGVSGPKASIPDDPVMVPIPLLGLSDETEPFEPGARDTPASAAVPAEESGAEGRVEPAPRHEVDVAVEPAPPQVEAYDVVATRRMVAVRKRAAGNAPIIGYVRSGSGVSVQGAAVETEACTFLPLEPRGYVCANEVSRDLEQPLARVWSEGANRRAALPYFYGRSKASPPPLYNRIPTAAEQRLTEPELGIRPHGFQAHWADIAGNPAPDFLRDGGSSLRANGSRRSTLAVASGRPIADSAFAFLQLFEVNSRYYGLSTDLSVLPLDHLEPVEASRFSGVALGTSISLPLVFVRAKNAYVYAGGPSFGLSPERPVEYREAFGLTGRRERAFGKRYLELSGGGWLVDSEALVVIEAPDSMPAWAEAGATWIDVSLERQTLVAYAGTRPVYATLVSTGLDVQAGSAESVRHSPGAGPSTAPSITPSAPPATSAAPANETAPEPSRATIQGTFRVHTKYVTATMDSDTPGDEYDLRDVPYVQYFDGNYALHAAFWHDDFGRPKSHGCINLSPLDARWLFEWTEPRVPRDWYAALSLLEGTRLRIRP